MAMSSIVKTVGQRIRAYRLRCGLTQEMLAEKANLHPTYIGQVERGEKNLTLTSLERILDALGVSFAELFSYLEQSGRAPDLPAQCYDLVHSKTPAQQKHLYRILLEADALCAKSNK